jgi:hypothetical protein
MTGQLTGHCHLQGQLFKMVGPTSSRCKQASEMASQVLCDCVALATLEIQPLGSPFYATRWLLRHLSQQDTAHCSWCRAAKCMNKSAAQKFKCGWSAWVTNTPTLLVFYSTYPYFPTQQKVSNFSLRIWHFLITVDKTLILYCSSTISYNPVTGVIKINLKLTAVI